MRTLSNPLNFLPAEKCYLFLNFTIEVKFRNQVWWGENYFSRDIQPWAFFAKIDTDIDRTAVFIKR